MKEKMKNKKKKVITAWLMCVMTAAQLSGCGSSTQTANSEEQADTSAGSAEQVTQDEQETTTADSSADAAVDVNRDIVIKDENGNEIIPTGDTTAGNYLISDNEMWFVPDVPFEVADCTIQLGKSGLASTDIVYDIYEKNGVKYDQISEWSSDSPFTEWAGTIPLEGNKSYTVDINCTIDQPTQEQMQDIVDSIADQIDLLKSQITFSEPPKEITVSCNGISYSNTLERTGGFGWYEENGSNGIQSYFSMRANGNWKISDGLELVIDKTALDSYVPDEQDTAVIYQGDQIIGSVTNTTSNLGGESAVRYQAYPVDGIVFTVTFDPVLLLQDSTAIENAPAWTDVFQVSSGDVTIKDPSEVTISKDTNSSSLGDSTKKDAIAEIVRLLQDTSKNNPDKCPPLSNFTTIEIANGANGNPEYEDGCAIMILTAHGGEGYFALGDEAVTTIDFQYDYFAGFGWIDKATGAVNEENIYATIEGMGL